jgi:hypothetical protein
MTDPKIKELAMHIFNSVESLSPYNRGSSEHRIYTAGWLAAHLARILQHDRLARNEFEDRVREQRQGPAAGD